MKLSFQILRQFMFFYLMTTYHYNLVIKINAKMNILQIHCIGCKNLASITWCWNNVNAYKIELSKKRQNLINLKKWMNFSCLQLFFCTRECMFSAHKEVFYFVLIQNYFCKFFCSCTFSLLFEMPATGAFCFNLF